MIYENIIYAKSYFLVWIIAQTVPFVFVFQLSYCVTDMELISPMGFLAPSAPDALIQ